jgi:HAD superfamily hydrolase (TIGR01459 family)
MTPTPIVAALADISEGYDALLCDLWGCLHNGVAAYPAAVNALLSFRRDGGKVILLTNAPRPAHEVIAQLNGMGVPRAAWDEVVTSGDAARAEVAAGRFGSRVEHVGPARDLAFFDGLPVTRVPRAEAEAVVLTGLFDDETETPNDYADAIADWVARGLPVLCANPDVVVDRGHQRIYCAGAIAEAMRAAGGAPVYTGKPHAPIYRLARERLAGLGVPSPRMLAIGDGIATDILGGDREGIDTLFVTGGLAAAAVSDDPERPDPARLERWLGTAPARPTWAIGRLR